MDQVRPKNYLDILSGECQALAERFRLNGDERETLRQFVTDTAMKSWRNGRAVGWLRGVEEHRAVTTAVTNSCPATPPQVAPTAPPGRKSRKAA
jgi:hypothetical protein